MHIFHTASDVCRHLHTLGKNRERAMVDVSVLGLWSVIMGAFYFYIRWVERG
tara:strand:+ start:1190 stop:1345 length:156 start_codon:yes stop_codon:yes gene_type:complete